MIERPPQHLRRTDVAVEDDSVRGQGHRALAHRLDELPIDAVGPAQGIDLFAALAGDHHRVHFPVADGAQHLLGFGQLGAESFQFRREVRF